MRRQFDFVAAAARLLLIPLMLALGSCAGTELRHPEARDVRVSRDGRHFVRPDGRPFLWLADTAWELFHRLTPEEAEFYLEDRKRKGFTVIQALVI